MSPKPTLFANYALAFPISAVSLCRVYEGPIKSKETLEFSHLCCFITIR